MKILHTVESYLPARHGMSEVVRQISERLVVLGHDVTVATSFHMDRQESVIQGVKIQAFDICGSITNGMKGEYDRYIQFLLENNFDIITNFAAQQWASDLAFPILNKIKAKKVFVPTGYSALNVNDYQAYYCRMPEWLKQYDRVVYLSDDYRDVNFARQHNIQNGVLIPNGAAEDEFLSPPSIDIRKKLGIPEDHLLVLHVSGYVGGKGHLETLQIFQRACLKKATLLFVCPSFEHGYPLLSLRNLALALLQQLLGIIRGRSFSKKVWEEIQFYWTLKIVNKDCQVLFTALNRAETISAYQAADLFLFPSHIECSPIVLFECLASKTPFLVTDVGNAREIIQWSDAGDLLPTNKTEDEYGNVTPLINESVARFIQLAGDSKKRNQMAASGFSAWRNRFTWEKIARDYETMYKELL